MKEALARFILNKVSVSEREMDIILDYFKPGVFKKNFILLREGDMANKMYFIVKGCMRIYFVKEGGTEVTRRILFENDSSSSLVSFITGKPSMEYIATVLDTQLLYITKTDFSYLLDNIPIWEKFYRRYLEYAYVTNTNRLMSFITHDATERYLALLKENPAIVQRLPNRLVANYLNITQEGLSRLKAKLG